MSVPTEDELLRAWWQVLRRDPDQPNGVHQSDAELLDLENGLRLAVTTDTIAEELALGFYPDPETVGWVAATTSLSDLAAVAAKPLGILVAATLPESETASYQLGVAKGLDAACLQSQTYIVGGDTNVGTLPTITTTAIGLVRRDRTLMRSGVRQGEIVYCSGIPGRGAAVAAKALFPKMATAVPPFRPIARLSEAQVLSRYASACIDTSDGVFAALHALGEVNELGFQLEDDILSRIDEVALGAMEELGLPPLMALASLHGEFELTFCVPENLCTSFEEAARLQGWTPVRLGRAIAARGVFVGDQRLDTGLIRDAFSNPDPVAATRLVSSLLPRA